MCGDKWRRKEVPLHKSSFNFYDLCLIFASTYLDNVNLLSAVVPHLKLLDVTFDVLCDPHRAHLDGQRDGDTVICSKALSSVM